MASGHDIKSATQTYNGFVKASTWGAAITVVIVAMVVGIIAS
ncbi:MULTISPECIES: aa3-type cytochrome c oxidase subunit IV [Novosphingobium]|jgi:hypothetical protein|uniref:Aa3 type cytochrome c oxidase subunit IV n=1 Tax=Novosphingobium panipatense TaxID=428991 RepID=A0ABY1Q3Z6_9SPHN|nr:MULTISPECIES: aa3-type cytochrome c oxidase subunit IV [Novosphingobium]SMP57146.1 aa3 type cytochrome c oxidase subunit IV [Novosphingobium panipatense]